MSDLKCIVAVPARLESSRLPNKVLKDIGGKSMIQRVLEQCSKSKRVDNIILCTDSERISQICKDLGYKVFITSKNFESGTDRIASKTKEIINHCWHEDIDFKDKLNKSIIINVQGDQPFVNPDLIDKTFSKLSSINCSSEIVTPIFKLSKSNIHNPNIVKTLVRKDGTVIYFSRSAIPHVRDLPEQDWHRKADYWGHAGIYGFKASMLIKWEEIKPSNLEKLEKLEQLRLIDSGYTISTFITDEDCLSVDTNEQLIYARSKINH